MDALQVKSGDDLSSFVSTLVKEQEKTYIGSLEEYLRALWGLIQSHQERPLTFALLAALLRDAFTAEPLPFDENWLIYKNPPPVVMDEGRIPVHLCQGVSND